MFVEFSAVRMSARATKRRSFGHYREAFQWVESARLDPHLPLLFRLPVLGRLVVALFAAA